jgi:hypothetical protein
MASHATRGGSPADAAASLAAAAAAAPTEEQTDADWLFDYLMEVFRSPTWEVPLMEFIDMHCVIFDQVRARTSHLASTTRGVRATAGQSAKMAQALTGNRYVHALHDVQDDENKLEYTSVHNEFCDLVERLLEAHLGDVGMAAEDFLNVCAAARNGRALNSFVFEQILAVDDFLTFKKIMCKRNMELELEAVRAAQDAARAAAAGVPVRAPARASAARPAAAAPPAAAEDDAELQAAMRLSEQLATDGYAVRHASDTEEERALADALQASLLDAEEARRLAEYEVAMLEAAIAASLALQDEQVRLQQERQEAEEQARQRAAAASVAAAAAAAAAASESAPAAAAAPAAAPSVQHSPTSDGGPGAHALAIAHAAEAAAGTAAASVAVGAAEPPASSSASMLRDLPSLPAPPRPRMAAGRIGGADAGGGAAAGTASVPAPPPSILDAVLNPAAALNAAAASAGRAGAAPAPRTAGSGLGVLPPIAGPKRGALIRAEALDMAFGIGGGVRYACIRHASALVQCFAGMTSSGGGAAR